MRTVEIQEVRRRIQLENPWWDPPHEISPTVSRWRPRAYLEPFLHLLRAGSVRRAVILLGPRRVGKTVMIHHAVRALLADGVPSRRIWYLSVDHPIYNGLRLDEFIDACADVTGTDPRKEEVYVFFDEVQYLRDWERHLKVLVDGYPQVRCTASGSAAAALRLKSNESGAGRFTDFLLPPLTFHEYLDLLGRSGLVTPYVDEAGRTRLRATDIAALNGEFLKYLNFGGYPEAILDAEIQADPARFIKSDIIDKVLLRDLPSLYGIQDIQELNHLFLTLAYNTAGEVSLGELAQKSGVAKNTLKRYIEYLEAAFLIRVVHRVDRNARRFKRATTFKVYLTNPSIRSALFSPVTAADEVTLGHLAETAVFAQWFHSDVGVPRLHYARWDEGEVDIVYVDAQMKPDWAVEVKYSDRCVESGREIAPLIDFCHEHNLRDTTVTTATRDLRTTIRSVDVHFVPASVYCYTVGYNVVTSKSNSVRGGLGDHDPSELPA